MIPDIVSIIIIHTNISIMVEMVKLMRHYISTCILLPLYVQNFIDIASPTTLLARTSESAVVERFSWLSSLNYTINMPKAMFL